MTLSIDELAVDTIRTLAMDAVQKADSGHAGTPMGMAPVAYTLWQEVLRYDPADPAWPGRDRFVLSVGHASMLLYALLHLAGVKSLDDEYAVVDTPAVSLDDIKKFRQIDSKCPGHPEYHLTSGVEATTGPLGQGVAMSVGMAMAQAWLAKHYNRPDFDLFDYRVYALAGDGCMMEGVSNEAASLAGSMRLSNLVWIYDSNRITIEGSTDLAFLEDVGARFLAQGWNVLRAADANDRKRIGQLLEEAKRETERPTLIVVSSIIGFGAPTKQGTRAAHSDALGVDEIKAAKKFYGWPDENSQFLVPDGVYDVFKEKIGKRGAETHAEWTALFAKYKAAYPKEGAELDAMFKGHVPEGWDKDLPVFEADEKGLATRESNEKVLNAVAKSIPFLIGGAADLAPSTKTLIKDEASFGSFDHSGRNLHFGVREHAMGCAVNGMVLSRMRAYGAGFFIFSDYMKPPLRLSALMEIPSIFIFTHDSIGVGEDGPTHQPIEQLATLRAVPGMLTLRPADANEVTECWRVIMGSRKHPVALALSRQKLPTFDRKRFAPAAGVAKGAYVLADAEGGTPEVLLIGTGSEVALCVQAWEVLTKKGVKARVVSMPSWELFEQQDDAYRESVLPDAVEARVSVEQAATLGWEKYVGRKGAKIGMHTFGGSAPLKDLLSKFGFTPDKVVEAAEAQIALYRKG